MSGNSEEINLKTVKCSQCLNLFKKGYYCTGCGETFCSDCLKEHERIMNPKFGIVCEKIN